MRQSLKMKMLNNVISPVAVLPKVMSEKCREEFKLMKPPKKMNFFILFVLAVLGGGCVSSRTSFRLSDLQQVTPTAIVSAAPNAVATESLFTTAPPTKTATVQFQILPVDPENYLPPLGYELPDFVEYDGDGKAWININAIYAIDKDAVFLAGSLSFPYGNYERSLLLRSTDGGEHWTEVMPTTILSYVEHIAFIDGGEGWALVTGVGELGASMPTMLWHTNNYGEIWNMAGTVSYGSSTFCGYKALRFYDSKHGEISWVCRDPSPDDFFAILATEDGGLTWQENYRLTLPLPINGDYLDEKLLAAFAVPDGGRYGSHKGNCILNIKECKAYGQDGSEWEAALFENDRTRLLVRRLLATESEWMTYALPACFEYQQGKLVGPCEP
jgi:photosystem II stability/assembly factor-like uncharacterized protein